MSIYGAQVAADGSDILAVQTATDEGSTTMAIRGYPVDIAGEVATLQVKNTVVGGFSGNH
jgi:hypothetical protein